MKKCFTLIGILIMLITTGCTNSHKAEIAQAQEFISQGSFNDALEVYNSFGSKESDTEIQKLNTILQFVEEGDANYGKGKYKEAVDNYSEALEIYEVPAIVEKLEQAKKDFETYEQVQTIIAEAATLVSNDKFKDALIKYEEALASTTISSQQSLITKRMSGVQSKIKWQELFLHIEKGKYETAKHILMELLPTSYLFSPLYKYASAKEYYIKYKNKDSAEHLMSGISPDYNEELVDEINEFKAILIPKNEWEYQFELYQQYALPTERETMESILRMNKSGPKIGMTDNEVINETSWGKPEDINKTTTVYGTSEQWVYSGYKYLYFDDGILTTIQE